jgi:hypothetical protein
MAETTGLSAEQLELLKQISEETEKAAEMTDRYSASMSGLNQMFDSAIERAQKKDKVMAAHLIKMQREMNKTGNEAEKAGKKIESSLNIDVDKMLKLARSGGFKDALEGIGTTISALGKDIVGFKGMVGGQFEEIGAIAKSLGAIGFAGLRVKAMEALDDIGYNKVQKELYEIEKQAIQGGQAFGESFGEADKSAETFTNALLKSVASIRATRDEVLDVGRALGDAFAARKVVDSIDSLKAGMRGVESEITLTNVALTVAKATGTDHTKIANMMASAHLELGTTIEDTALSMGHIKDAAKDSGLHFKSVADTIFGSAKALKYYGTTIDSVSPLFKSFNESLRGVGREGLTPELLNKFVGGLQKMSFSTRALLGLSAPGGAAAGGILGGGLKMEKALETGEGMGEIAQSISETMKKFAGGPIMTREEAMETGNERDYIIQRQILGQLTGINDPGEANMMMGILKDIDKNGIAGNADSITQLEKMMKQGEETAEKTTTDLKSAQLDFYTTQTGQGEKLIDSGKKIYSILDKISSTLLGGRKLGDITRAIAGGGTGELNLETILGTAKVPTKEGEGRASQIESWQGAQAETKAAEVSEVESYPVKAEAIDMGSDGDRIGEKIASKLREMASKIPGSETPDTIYKRAEEMVGTARQEAEHPVVSNVANDRIRAEPIRDIRRTTTGAAGKPTTASTLVTPPKQEVEGTITIRLEVDDNGNLITTDKVATIVNGAIEDAATGAKSH